MGRLGIVGILPRTSKLEGGGIMRQFTINGITCRLHEQEYHVLMQRFDDRAATRTPLGNWKISRSCFCPTRRICVDCPLNVFRDTEHNIVGCHVLLRKLNLAIPRSLALHPVYVMWPNSRESNTACREFLRSVRKLLLGLKKERWTKKLPVDANRERHEGEN